jgi:hypothetical protein
VHAAKPTGRKPRISGDTLNLVLAAAGIVGDAVVSYHFYRISKKEPLPVYIGGGEIVVERDTKRGIEVRYRGDEVPMVSRTVIAFWNAGREPIRRDDLVENHPLTVRLPDDSALLEARVLGSTKPEVDFACFPNERYAGINFGFSFLNHRDGGAIEILHTGDDPVDVRVEGAIVGVEGPPILIETPLWDDSRMVSFPLGALLLLAGVGCFVAAGLIEGTQEALGVPSRRAN